MAITAADIDGYMAANGFPMDAWGIERALNKYNRERGNAEYLNEFDIGAAYGLSPYDAIMWLAQNPGATPNAIYGSSFTPAEIEQFMASLGLQMDALGIILALKAYNTGNPPSSYKSVFDIAAAYGMTAFDALSWLAANSASLPRGAPASAPAATPAVTPAPSSGVIVNYQTGIGPTNYPDLTPQIIENYLASNGYTFDAAGIRLAMQRHHAENPGLPLMTVYDVGAAYGLIPADVDVWLAQNPGTTGTTITTTKPWIGEELFALFAATFGFTQNNVQPEQWHFGNKVVELMRNHDLNFDGSGLTEAAKLWGALYGGTVTIYDLGSALAVTKSEMDAWIAAYPGTLQLAPWGSTPMTPTAPATPTPTPTPAPWTSTGSMPTTTPTTTPTTAPWSPPVLPKTTTTPTTTPTTMPWTTTGAIPQPPTTPLYPEGTPTEPGAEKPGLGIKALLLLASAFTFLTN